LSISKKISIIFDPTRLDQICVSTVDPTSISNMTARHDQFCPDLRNRAVSLLLPCVYWRSRITIS